MLGRLAKDQTHSTTIKWSDEHMKFIYSSGLRMLELPLNNAIEKKKEESLFKDSLMNHQSYRLLPCFYTNKFASFAKFVVYSLQGNDTTLFSDYFKVIKSCVHPVYCFNYSRIQESGRYR